MELDLWGRPGPSRLRADVTTLDRAVSQLPLLVRSTQLDPLTLTLRAHEISENALQVQLTGKDDFGSHTDLESVRAELVGTQAVLTALARPIDSRVHTPTRSGRHCVAPWPPSRRRPGRRSTAPSPVSPVRSASASTRPSTC